MFYEMWSESLDNGHDEDTDPDSFQSWLIRRRLPSCIIPGKLWLGDYRGLHDEAFVKREGIKGVISLGSMDDHVHYKIYPDLAHHFVFIDDNSREPIHEHFDECSAFIRDTDGPIYVHCWAGVSRSATIVLAYLIMVNKMEMKDAWEMVKQRRPCLSPNEGFKEALWKLSEKSHLDKM